jgi:hypothetical protein
MMRVTPAAPPFPGAGVSRLNGRYAVCTVANLTLTAFEWEVEVTTEFVDGTGHGDIWDVPVPLKYAWTGRVRGYYSTANNPYMHLYNGQIAAPPPPDITAIAFTGYKDDTPTTAVFAGNGFVVRARWNVPNAMLEQELEIRGTGIPGTLT